MDVAELIRTIINQLPGFIFGVVATLLVAVGTGFIKEFFDERARKKKHKLEVARHVLRICNEASSGNFKRFPRDNEHVNSVITDTEGIDNSMGSVMNKFVSLWSLIAQISQSHLGREETKHLMEMNKEIEEKRKILVAWANKIRTGKQQELE